MQRSAENFSQNSSFISQTSSVSLLELLRDAWFLCLAHWKWFLLSVILTLSGAYYYLLRTPKTYVASASILIKPDNNRGNSPDQLLARQRMVVEGASDAQMTNEILALSSATITRSVAERLNLDVEYAHKGMFHDKVIYGSELPVKVEFLNIGEEQRAAFHLSLQADGRVVLDDFSKDGANLSGTIMGKVGERCVTPVGLVKLVANTGYRPGTTDEYKVTRSPISSVAASVRGSFSIALSNKASTIIDIQYSDVNTARAKDAIDMLISVYNENWVRDRNQISVSTNEFIKERLAVIQRELGSVDQNIAGYKSANLLPDVEQSGSMAVTQANDAEAKARELSTQVYMTRHVKEYLTDGRHENQVLPSNSGINNASIQAQINDYNTRLLERNRLLATSSAQNPAVMDLETQLGSIRRGIIQSLDNELDMLKTQQRVTEASHSEATSKISANPRQASYLLSVERQQKVKESLYLFLLQKREENELSQAFTAYNTQIIETPHITGIPPQPVSRNILLTAFLIGLAIPATFVFGREALNSTVRGRKDLEDYSMPLVGELPLKGKKRPVWKRWRKEKIVAVPNMVVADQKRDILNEAFRTVRTKLEFTLGFDGRNKVVMLSSLNPGSGKTFITANLGAAFSLKGKRVLVMDLDLRKASLSDYVGQPKVGISNYLSGQIEDWHEIITPLNRVDVLPCGVIPPNPAELLSTERFAEMIKAAREEYDIIFLDCPPVEIVADAEIINPHADLTLFIVRASLMERSYLKDIERWYAEKKYNNLTLLLNGTTDALGRYGYHKYGYGYGGYGYGYGSKK